jgi:hypothetical protein
MFRENMIRSPTIRPKPGFDSQREAEALHKAMEGKGCDKDAILTLIVECTNNQVRTDIFRLLNSIFSANWLVALISETSKRAWPMT